MRKNVGIYNVYNLSLSIKFSLSLLTLISISLIHRSSLDCITSIHYGTQSSAIDKNQ